MEVMDLKLNPRVWKICSTELAQFTNRNIADIAGEYEHIVSGEKPEENSLYDNSDTGRINDFYSKTTRFLYELVRWEATFDKQKNFERIAFFLKKNRADDILDFGGGVGGCCLYLRERGLSCDYVDIPGNTFNFAQWRFQKRGINVAMHNSLKDWPVKKYSAVTAYDVLEHLPDIETTVKRISETLRPQGFLIAKSTFSGGGLHLKKNEIYMDIKAFNALLAKYGLGYKGRLKSSIFSELLEKTGLGVCGIRIDPKVKYGGNFLIYQKVIF